MKRLELELVYLIKLIDKLGNIKKPTVYFSNKALQVIGVINNIDYSSLIYKNSDFVPEASFNVYKELNGVKCRFWDDLEALSIVYFKEYNTYFECEVDIDEEDSIYKKITCTFLPVAELSQVNLYNVEINTEDDIKNDDFTGASQFYNPSDHKRSILHRIIDNFAPHYTLDTVVPSTLKQLQRSFSFNNESVYNALNKIEKEIGCKFIYDSANRKISVIDMYSTCNKCGFRGEFYTECPICGSKDITLPYGKKTSIFFSNRNLSKRVVVSAEEKDIKNTFYLVTGDEDMDTAVMALNPSGTRYLYCFTDSLRKKFTPALRTAIESYENTYDKINDSAYPLTSNGLSADDANAFNKIVDKYNAEAFYDLKYDKNDNKVLMGNEFLKADSATSYQELVLLKSSIDEMNSYLTHSLEPIVNVDLKTAKGQAEQVKQAGDFELGIIGYDANKSDDYTKRVQSGVKQIVNICLSSGYKVEIKNITYGDIISSSPSSRWWNFTITLIKYSDDTDKADVDIRVKVSAGYDTYLTNYMDRTLNSERDMSGVYRVLYHKGTDEDITNALAFFSSQRLNSFYIAYDEALNAINSSNAGNDNEKQEITKQVYDKYKHTQELIKAELDERTVEIATVKKAKDICDKIIKEKRDILNFDKYLKDKNVFNEYFAYRREDEYSNSNYVSTDLTYKEMMRRASDFLAVAREEINKASRTIYTIEGTLNNFLVLPVFEDKVKELGIYDFITYRVDNKLFRLRLISYEITFNESSIDELELKFSNGIEGLTVDSLSETAKILQNAKDVSSHYDAMKTQMGLNEREIQGAIDRAYGLTGNFYNANANFNQLSANNLTVNGRLEANEGYIHDLTADNVTIKNKLTAHEGEFDDLKAHNLAVDGKLTANEADIKDLHAENATVSGRLDTNEANIKTLTSDYENVNALVAKKIDADEVIAKYVTTDTLETEYTKTKDLEAEYTKTTDLEAKYATIDNLNANKAELDTVIANKIDSKVVNADFVKTKDLEADYTKTTDLEANYAKVDNLKAQTARIDILEGDSSSFHDTYTKNLEADRGRISTLEGDTSKFKDTYTENLTADRGRISTLEGDSATFKDTYTKNLTADRGRISTLETGYEKVGIIDGDVANIKAIMSGSVGTGSLQSITLNSDNATLANGMIKNAMIENLSFDKITGFDVNTKKVTVHSDDGLSTWKDNTISIKDSNKTVRVQIGKDAEGDYNMYIWDKDGKLMFDPLGITKDGINRQVIDNDAVADDAMISGSKLDINSVIKSINANTGEEKLTSNSIKVDEKNGTLTAVLNEMTTGISDNLSKINDANTNISNVSTSLETVSRQVESNNNHVTDLMTRTSQVETSVTNLKSDVDNVADTESTHYSNLTNQYNNQQTTINGTITRLGNAENKIATVADDLSNLSIGGRNLIVLTTSRDGYRLDESGNDYADQNNTITDYFDVYPSCDYTMSISKDLPILESSYYELCLYDKDKKHISRVIMYESGSFKAGREHGVTIKSQSNAVYGKISFPINAKKYVKFELGNKASDWTPAPEDFENKISEQSNEFATYKQTIDGSLSSIGSTYQRKDDMKNYATNSSVQSAINQSKTDITNSVSSNYVKTLNYNTDKQSIETRMSSAEQKITSDAIVSTVKSSRDWSDLQKNASKLDWQIIEDSVDLDTMTTDGRYLLKGGLKQYITYDDCYLIDDNGNQIIEDIKNILNQDNNNGWQYLIVESVLNEDRVTQTIWNDNDAETGYTRKLKPDGSWTPWVRESNSSNAISIINQSAENIKIKADLIDIDGLVTFHGGNNAINNRIDEAKKAGTDASETFNNWRNYYNVDNKLSHAYALVNRWAQDATSDVTTINGGLIETNTITAEKIAVDDLYAFGATIGNFVIDSDKIRSSNKNEYNDNNNGVVLQNKGSISRVGIGAKNGDHIIFDENGLDISVKNLNIIQSDNSKTSIGDYVNNATNGSIIGYEYIQTNSAITVPSASDANWSSTMPSWKNGYYIWQRTIQKNGGQTVKGTPLCISGSKGEQGERGLQGIQGVKGNDGYSPSVSISKSGSTSTITITDKSGTHTATVLDGAKGTAGDKGADGKTTYFHVKYSNDGGKTFTTNNGEDIGDYIGTKTDFTEADSTNVADYTWARIKGEQGAQGLRGLQGEKGEQGIAGKNGIDGTNGKTSYFHVKYSLVANPTSSSQLTETPSTYIGTYVDFTEADSTDPKAYSWTQFKGSQGAKGDQGVAGKNGVDGKTSYLHIAYANSADGSSDFDISNGENKQYIGQYTDFTQADSTDRTKYTWTKIKGEQGERGLQGIQGVKGDQGIPGTNGKTSYFHIKYSLVANPTNASQLTETPSTYIGTYVDFVETDSTDPSKYTWTQFKGSQGAKGDQGIAGKNGTDGKTSYLHIAYANSADGSSGFDVSNGEGKLYIGQYTDFTQDDSTDHTKYTWTKIKGEQGIQGVKGDKGDQGIQGVKGDQGDTYTTEINYIQGGNIMDDNNKIDILEAVILKNGNVINDIDPYKICWYNNDVYIGNGKTYKIDSGCYPDYNSYRWNIYFIYDDDKADDNRLLDDNGNYLKYGNDYLM